MAQQKKTGGLGRGLKSLISNAMVEQAKTASFSKKNKGAKSVPASAKKSASAPAGTSSANSRKKPAKSVPAKPTPTKISPAKNVPAAKAVSAKSSAPAKSAPSGNVPAKSVPAKKVSEKTVPAKRVPVAPEKTPPPAPAVPAPAANALPFREIAVDAVVPAPHQSRRAFDDSSLRELADSIRAEGLLQPIVVREISDGKFELIAGERRWRAFQALHLKAIPARVVKASDASSAAMTLIENLQREDLNPIEEALGLGSLMRDFNLTQEAVSERVGKARSSVANALRLLSLETEIQGFIATGMLSVGHAKVLLGVEDAAQRLVLARRFVETRCSVRTAEFMAKRARDGRFAGTDDDEPVVRQISDEIFRIEKMLCSFFHTKVLVKHGRKSGKILIEYRGNDELARLLECFGVKN